MTTVAAIDCGTNSIRLLVAEVAEGRLVDLDRRMTVVRLGEGVDRTGRLAPEALQRTFAACTDYGRIIDDLGAARVRFVATSASRDADNAADFVAGVRDILAVTPEVISGAEEARLSYIGATRGLPHAEPVLVFDIGGGSTEFVLGDGGVRQSASVDMGCVRFHERYLSGDPPTGLARLRQEAATLVERGTAGMPLGEVRDVVGLAGTVTTVAALAMGLPTYDSEAIHGARITTADAQRVAEELARLTLAEREALPVMHPGRADVIVSGAAILSEILTGVGADSFVAGEHDILDGIAWSLAEI
ncbi:MAG: Ppx/GppA phosphatase family protein [Candidatus Nanopelagicales bacterium]